MFEKEGVDSNKFGCEILGVYGTGGLGKTALCQTLCNHFQLKFRGRVCHVELGNDRLKDDPALVKLALRKLTNLREDLVNNIHSKSQVCIYSNLMYMHQTWCISLFVWK